MATAAPGTVSRGITQRLSSLLRLRQLDYLAVGAVADEDGVVIVVRLTTERPIGNIDPF
jgi:hypothetical protein